MKSYTAEASATKVWAFIAMILLVTIALFGAGEATCEDISFFDTTCGKLGCAGSLLAGLIFWRKGKKGK